MTTNYYSNCVDKWHMPVLKVPRILNPFHKDGVDVYVMLANHLPYENIKFLSMAGLVREAIRLGAFEGVDEVVEATSGNAGIALAYLLPKNLRLRLIVPGDMPDGKRTPLLLAGATLASVPKKDKNDKKPQITAVQYARELGGGGWNPKAGNWHKDRKNRRINLDQYACPFNYCLHKEFTAPQIMVNIQPQRKKKKRVYPKYLALGIGTGGTAIGLSKALRPHNQKLEIIGVLCATTVPMTEVPGVRDRERMKDIKLPWEAACDHVEEVERDPSYLVAAWFHLFMGVTPGPSSGLAYAGAMRFLKKQKKARKLPKQRGKKSRDVMVVIFPDGSRPYGERFTANVAFEADRRSLQKPLQWSRIM